MKPMFEATVSEFPFVAELPRAEKRQAKSLWDRFRDLSKLAETNGVLVPPSLAAALLDISKQRVHQLMVDGKLERIEFEGHPFITENSIVALAKTERKAGRPFRIPETMTDCAKVAWKGRKDSQR